MRVKYIAIFLLTLSISAAAQKNDCELTLRTALDEFNAGHFYGLSSILKPCMDNGFTREQRQRANLLLVQTYLLLDDPESAERSYLELLKANPEFVTDIARDPIDVVYLSKKFTSSPIFSLFAKIGPNISPVRPIHENNLYQSLDTVSFRKKYIIKPGWQFSLGSDLNINDQFSVSLAAQLMTTSYEQNSYNSFGRDKASFVDKQTWLNFPLSVKYSLDKGRFKPFVFVGFSANILLSDKANIRYTDVLDASGASQSVNVQNLNFLYKRNRLNGSMFFGGGVKRKIRLNYVFADLRYSLGLGNVVNTKNLYGSAGNSKQYSQSMEALMHYGHLDDYFRLDNFSISIGYIHPLYKPRKLKKARTKSVMKNIRNQKGDVHEK